MLNGQDNCLDQLLNRLGQVNGTQFRGQGMAHNSQDGEMAHNSEDTQFRGRGKGTQFNPNNHLADLDLLIQAPNI